MKPNYIVKSMAIQDNMLDGGSYFIAEIQFLKRIMRLGKEEKTLISFVDKIFKGTNTVKKDFSICFNYGLAIFKSKNDNNCIA